MYLLNTNILVLIVIFLVAKWSGQTLGQAPVMVESKFRILAPQFICPKDENQVVEKPDNTVITDDVSPFVEISEVIKIANAVRYSKRINEYALIPTNNAHVSIQTAAEVDLRIEWTVRWIPLTAPTQRFTLMLWKTVRNLEKQLNKSPPELYVYIIENSELLPGVNYIFNVSSIEADGQVSDPKTFNIDNTQGDPKLMIDGRNDMLSVVLVAAQTAYVDDEFVVEALVTTCTPMQEFYFIWTVQAYGSNDTEYLPQEQGSRLEVPSCTLKAGFVYNVNCRIMRLNTEELITQTSLPFSVQHRGLEVYLSIDYLQISKNKPFSIESLVVSHDYCDTPIYEWDCRCNGESCTATIVMEQESMYFPSGLAELGKYFITLSVFVIDQTTIANATIVVVDPSLPIIQLTPLPRVVNKGTTVNVAANITELTPTCTIAWYFANEEYLDSLNLVTTNDTICEECQHGEALPGTVTIYSLEEQFLSELSDFTNETESREATASFPASDGRARLVVDCGCSLTFSCESQGTVYADVWLQMNDRPKTRDVLLSPESGTALETVFRVSTLAALDQDVPLRYSFYCAVGNDTILLASFVDHRAVETLLPYSKDGTEVWVQVCDALGACSKGRSRTITLSPGEGRTVDALVYDASAHARRCEMIPLMQVVQSTIVTYINTRQSDTLETFNKSLQTFLTRMDEKCITKYYKQYSQLLFWLASHGVETNNLPYSS